MGKKNTATDYTQNYTYNPVPYNAVDSSRENTIFSLHFWPRPSRKITRLKRESSSQALRGEMISNIAFYISRMLHWIALKTSLCSQHWAATAAVRSLPLFLYNLWIRCWSGCVRVSLLTDSAPLADRMRRPSVWELSLMFSLGFALHASNIMALYLFILQFPFSMRCDDDDDHLSCVCVCVLFFYSPCISASLNLFLCHSPRPHHANIITSFF